MKLIMKWKEVLLLSMLLFLVLNWASLAEAGSSQGHLKLTRQDAVRIAIDKNPMVAGLLERLKGLKGDVLQARLMPNPDLSIEVENFGGSGDLSGFKGAETTIGIEQVIETGGKRRDRLNVAQKGLEIGYLDYEIAKLEIAAMAEKAFWRSYISGEKVDLTQELLNLAKATLKTVSARVEAGKVSQIEEIKAKVFLSTAKILHREAIHQSLVARNELITVLGDEAHVAQFILEADDPIVPPPSFDKLLLEMKKGLRFKRLILKEELAKKRFDLARSYGVPDLKFGIGIRHFEDTRDQALIASISMPIPIFNRNNGEKLKTLHEIAQRKHERRAGELELTQRLFEGYQVLDNSHEELNRLIRETLPNAKKGVEATKEGYAHGKFAYLDVLDAQRTLYELELRYLDALLRYRLSLADIKALTGDIRFE